jgi:hypothetical protein
MNQKFNSKTTKPELQNMIQENWVEIAALQRENSVLKTDNDVLQRSVLTAKKPDPGKTRDPKSGEVCPVCRSPRWRLTEAGGFHRACDNCGAEWRPAGDRTMSVSIPMDPPPDVAKANAAREDAAKANAARAAAERALEISDAEVMIWREAFRLLASKGDCR